MTSEFQFDGKVFYLFKVREKSFVYQEIATSLSRIKHHIANSVNAFFVRN